MGIVDYISRRETSKDIFYNESVYCKYTGSLSDNIALQFVPAANAVALVFQYLSHNLYTEVFQKVFPMYIEIKQCTFTWLTVVCPKSVLTLIILLTHPLNQKMNKDRGLLQGFTDDISNLPNVMLHVLPQKCGQLGLWNPWLNVGTHSLIKINGLKYIRTCKVEC